MCIRDRLDGESREKDMYCENCGKKLEDGEVCSCQKPAVNKKRKKKSKIQINIYMLSLIHI